MRYAPALILSLALVAGLSGCSGVVRTEQTEQQTAVTYGRTFLKAVRPFINKEGDVKGLACSLRMHFTDDGRVGGYEILRGGSHLFCERVTAGIVQAHKLNALPALPSSLRASVGTRPLVFDFYS